MKIKRKTLVKIIRYTTLLLSVSFIVLSVYFYFGTSFFSVTSYDIRGVDNLTKIAIDQKLHEDASKKFFKFFPSNKIYTYSTKRITETVFGEVPEIGSLTISPKGLHTLVIDIKRLTPVFKINESQALTNDGIMFSTKENLDPYPRIEIASSTTSVFQNKSLTLTEIIIPDKIDKRELLTNVSDLSSKISSVIFPVEIISISVDGDVTYYSMSKTSMVKILKDSDFKKTWSTLVSAIDTEPLKTKLASSKETLEYLDVRYGNKVFYRFSDMTFQKGSVNGILGNHATTTTQATATQAH